MKKKSPTDSRSEAVPSVHLFYGDEFLVKEQVERLVSELLDPERRATNLVVLDGNNLDISELSTELFTPSLFGGCRVVQVDQTSLFMGGTDRKRLTEKVERSWKTNDRKAAHRALAQLLGVVGLDPRDMARGSEWLNEVLDDSAGREKAETLLQVAKSFLESGEAVKSRADEADVEELIKSSFPADTILIFTASGVDKRKRLYKAVEKHGRVVECAIRQEKFGAGMERSFFEEQVRQALDRAGKTISQPAIDKMYARTGNELRRLQSEIAKLIAYVGDRGEIGSEDVEELFADFHQAAFYEITRALRTGETRRCLTALDDNLKIVAHPLQTLAAIANEYRRLMVARELLFTTFRPYWKAGMSYQRFVPVAKKAREERADKATKGKFNLLSMKDYPLYLYLKDAQRFPMEILVRIMEAILEADVLMKSTKVGSVSPRSIMEDLVLNICSMSVSRTDLNRNDSN
ncbi:MAG: DNA polymerase III subunit delta [Deltaproteobacteria bacterium]